MISQIAFSHQHQWFGTMKTGTYTLYGVESEIRVKLNKMGGFLNYTFTKSEDVVIAHGKHLSI